MDFRGIQLNGILLTSDNAYDNYIPLPEQSIALVGPNGIGKTTLIESIQKTFNGIEVEPGNPYRIHLDISLPINIDLWLENHDDPGLLNSVYKKLLANQENYVVLDDDISTSNFYKAIENIWKNQINDLISNWSYSFDLDEQTDYFEDELMQQMYQREFAWGNKIRRPISKIENYDPELGKKLVEESNNWEDSIKKSVNVRDFGFTLLLSAKGTETNPKWKYEIIYKYSKNDIVSSPLLTELCQVINWPNPINKSELTEKEYENQNIQIKKFKNEFWILMNLGFSDANPGIELLNPDHLEMGSLQSEIREYLSSISLYGDDKEEKLRIIFNMINEMASNKIYVRAGMESETRALNLFNPNGNISEEFRLYLERFSDFITEIFHSFLPSAPRIEIRSNPRKDWLSKGLLSFEVSDGQKSYSISSLSATQIRWAKLALLLTTYYFKSMALFIDEPEKGIQRKLERNLLQLFSDEFEVFNVPRFLATHSAEIISGCEGVIQIKRKEDGSRIIEKIPGSIQGILNELDISEEEYFQTKKLVIFTEGKIDKAILEGFADEIFRRENIEVISAYGLNSWKAYFDSNFLGKSSGIKRVFWADSIDVSKLTILVQDINKKRIPNSQIAAHLRARLQEVINEKWSDDQISTLSAIIADDLISGENKVKIVSTGDWDCIQWIDPSILGIKGRKDWKTIQADFEKQSRPKYPTMTKGQFFKKYVNSLLSASGVEKGLEISRLRSIAKELQISGQTPDKLQLLIDDIVLFSRK